MEQGLLGIFSYLDDLLRAVKSLKKAHVRIDTIISPVPHLDIEEALGVRPSPVRYFTLLGGLLGGAGGVGLASYAHLQWKLITGGKPVIPWIPFIVIGFEFCILAGVLSTILGLMIKNRMPRFRVPDPYDPRFTEDRFGLVTRCPVSRQEEVSSLLKEAGAEEVKFLK
jgi:hypothetical protein